MFQDSSDFKIKTRIFDVDGRPRPDIIAKHMLDSLGLAQLPIFVIYASYAISSWKFLP